MKIIDININEQKKALFRKKGGGNEWKNLDEKGKKQVLNEKQILELAKLIKKIEDHYGIPQDIEWAQDKNGKFFITQSRPITTLGDTDKKEVGEDKVLDFVKNNKFQKQFVYSFLPIICFESANYCYINNPLKEKLGIKEFPSFVVLWKDNYEDWGGGNIQKIKDKKQIQFIIDENRKIVEKYKERVNSLLKIKYKELTNKEIVKILREIDEISIEIYHRYIYLIHDYFETEDKGFIKLLPEVRIEMSEFVDKLYKSCDSIIEALAEKFESIPWKTFLYATFEEIIHLLENPETINEFKKVYKRSISFVFNGEKLSIIKEKERVEKIINILENQKQDIGNDIDRFEGNIAFKGNAKGRVVKVLEFDYEKV